MSTAFDWSASYPSRRLPVFGRDVVSTSHPYAAQAGLRMLQAGGNAIDAAIAAAAAMTIVEPCSNGLGSDLFCILWDGERLHGLNASGTAPAAWTPEYFRRKYGADAKAPPKRGWDSVTVPGAVAGWQALHRRFGSLPFADLIAPAIDIAERGYAVPVVVQSKWANAAALPELAGQPGFAQAFLPKGRAPHIAERWAFPDAARSLRLIAQTGGEAFYRGEIAAAVAAHAQAHGAAMTEADFAAYAPDWVEPLAQGYRGHVLHEIPPNGQGIAAQIALGILQHFELAGLQADGVEAQHLQIEAMKLAFADVYRHVADPRGMTFPPAALLEPAYLESRAKLIDRRRAQDFGAGNPVRGGTIYLTTADARGRMVSLIQSNYMGFGSGVVVPGVGVSLQNRGHGFSLDAASPNCVAPGRRPFHTIIPGFLTKDGRPQMSFGVMGGNMQPQGHVQALVRMLDFGQPPQAACDAPRWRFNQGLSLNVEPEMPAATVAGLRALGHQVEDFQDSYQDFGAGQFIWRLGDPAVEGYMAASDPRRDGQAAAVLKPLASLAPGWRTLLAFARFDGEVVDRGDHLSVRSPANPADRRGNFLLYERPPQPGEAAAWLAAFAQEVGAGQAEAPGPAFGIDGGGDFELPADFAAAGLAKRRFATLLLEPDMLDPAVPPLPRECSIRALELPARNAQLVALDLAIDAGARPEAEVTAFRTRQMERFTAMQDAGLGHWFGVFAKSPQGEQLVAACGLFREKRGRDGTARFVDLGTHADWRGRGLATALLHRVCRHGFEVIGDKALVVAAEPSGALQRLCEGLGFERDADVYALEAAGPLPA